MKVNSDLVVSAYYVLCRDCASAKGVCAKCCKGDCDIIPPEPDDMEKLRLELEMKVLIKSLPERKRRTFLRFMKGKKKQPSEDAEEDGEAAEEEQESKKAPRKTREELLNKIDQLKGEGNTIGEDDNGGMSDSDEYSESDFF
jgi:hypothetical protein